MPYASDKQRGWMHIHHPEIAKRWDKEENEMADEREKTDAQGQADAEKIDGPEAFHKEMEKRMMRLSAYKVGQVLNVDWDGPSKVVIVECKGNQYRIKRQGGSDELWVSASELQEMLR